MTNTTPLISQAPRLLLHVGYHKTATTWMQRNLFQPEHGFRQLADHQEISDRVERPLELTFEPTPMRNLISERMTDLIPGEVPVISSEILSGHPFQAGREGGVIAHRLKRIVPDARILISIRAQQRILPSVYMQYLLRGGTMPPARFFAGTTTPGYFGFDAVHFEYHRLVALYQNLFGADNVFVLPQEALKRDIDAAASDLATFAEATRFAGLNREAYKVQGASYPEYGVSIMRRVNYLQSSTLNPTPIIRLGQTPGGLYKGLGYVLKRWPISQIFAGRQPVSSIVDAQFAGRFAQSNACLTQITSHPLNLNGYDVADSGDMPYVKS